MRSIHLLSLLNCCVALQAQSRRAPPLVKPGIDQLTAELTGFKRFTQTGLALETATQHALDITLEVGAAVVEKRGNASLGRINSLIGGIPDAHHPARTALQILSGGGRAPGHADPAETHEFDRERRALRWKAVSASTASHVSSGSVICIARSTAQQ